MIIKQNANQCIKMSLDIIKRNAKNVWIIKKKERKNHNREAGQTNKQKRWEKLKI